MVMGIAGGIAADIARVDKTTIDGRKSDCRTIGVENGVVNDANIFKPTIRRGSELNPVGTGSYRIIVNKHILANMVDTMRFQANSIVGCVEPTTDASTFGSTDACLVNLPRCLFRALNGGNGNDVIDYSQRTLAVAVDLKVPTATAIGSFSSIEGFIGSQAVDTFAADNVNNTWQITGNDQPLRSGKLVVE